MIRNLLIIFILSGILFSCSSNPTKIKVSTPVHKFTDDQLININKGLMQNEKKEIDAFVAQKGWKMQITSTGLRYMIINQGNGPKAKVGNIATIAYSVRLMKGPVVYSSEQSGLKSFEIGHGGVVTGLEEGIILLKVGEKAKFILPSHLAYGLTGDGNKVPPHTPIIYTVELVNLN